MNPGKNKSGANSDERRFGRLAATGDARRGTEPDQKGDWPFHLQGVGHHHNHSCARLPMQGMAQRKPAN